MKISFNDKAKGPNGFSYHSIRVTPEPNRGLWTYWSRLDMKWLSHESHGLEDLVICQ